MNKTSQGLWVIIVSLVISLVLSILPWPEVIEAFIPNWFFLVFVYWVIAVPHRVSLLWAFVWGLILDSLFGSLLGSHSFILCIITFIMQINYQKLRLQPLWQQALTIVVISFVYSLLNLWISRINGGSGVGWDYWLQPIANGLLWPWVFILLRDLRRYFKVS